MSVFVLFQDVLEDLVVDYWKITLTGLGTFVNQYTTISYVLDNLIKITSKTLLECLHEVYWSIPKWSIAMRQVWMTSLLCSNNRVIRQTVNTSLPCLRRWGLRNHTLWHFRFDFVYLACLQRSINLFISLFFSLVTGFARCPLLLNFPLFWYYSLRNNLIDNVDKWQLAQKYQ